MSILKKAMLLSGFLLSAALCLGQAVDTEEAFMNRIQEVSQSYMPVLQGLEAMALDGRMAEANLKLINHVPEAERTAVHNFMLGNFLYRIDHEKSFEFHKKAYEMAPSISAVTLEYGMELHRRGQYAEALKLYQSVEAELIPQHFVLLADCYINTGQPVKALQAWNMTEHKENPNGVDYMIHGIYGDDIPQARRNQILPELAKKPELINELLLLDLEWRSDWWSEGPNPEALTRDMPLFEKAFGAEDMIALGQIIDMKTEKQAPAGLRTALETHGLILKKGKLPKNSLIAKLLIQVMLKEEISNAATILEDFREELNKRGNKKDGDLEALRLLAELQKAVDPSKMAEIDKAGWEYYRNLEFLIRHLTTSVKGLDDPLLAEAIKAFPEHPFPRYTRMVLAEAQGKLTSDMVVDLIIAEFKGLRSNDFHSSGDLKAWFTKLEDTL